jgi:hypothetical protein
VFKPVGNRCSRRGAMGSEKPLGTHDMGFSKNLENGRMVLPDRLRRTHSRAQAPGVLPLVMVVMKHILTGLQHGSPKRDAP